MFSSAFKSFWHAMTSNDRHSNYNSPYRTGQHVPLNPDNGRMSGLASVATASESRQDVSNPYFDDSMMPPSRHHSPAVGGPGGPGAASPGMPPTPGSSSHVPYSPGSRSDSARRQSQTVGGSGGGDGFEMQSPTGEIPMQSFQDGQAPAPPVSNSWRRIDKWAEENYPELFDQLCEGCTNNDINELEHILDRTLPNDVRESLQVHDGQERGGIPTGIIFGCMLLDCEEIVQEWDNWRRVNTEFLQQSAAAAASRAAAAAAAAAGSSKDRPSTSNGSARSSVDGGSVHNGEESSSRSAPPSVAGNANPMWRQELLSRQDSVPPAAVQKAYVHPGWIPLVRDWGGNNLAVDLAPGPRGQWGQVIMFGRDYDTKYVVARSWSAFLALVADDLSSGKWFIDEDNNELKLREFKSTRVEPPYLDILRWRMDQKYGRRANKRKSAVPGAAGSPTNTGSPYASPTEPGGAGGAAGAAGGPGDRGRPLQRLSLSSPLVSPSRPGYGSKLSPLARVTEETSLPELNMTLPTNEEAETLVPASAPRAPPSRPAAARPPPPPRSASSSTTTAAAATTASAATAATSNAAAASASGAPSSPTRSSSDLEIVNDENAPAGNPTRAGKKTTIEDELDDAMKTIEI